MDIKNYNFNNTYVIFFTTCYVQNFKYKKNILFDYLKNQIHDNFCLFSELG